MTEYILTDEIILHEGLKLHRIQLTKDCKWGTVGNLGGFIESKTNLSGDAWVTGTAKVYGNAKVYGDALVFGDAQVFGDALVCGNSQVCGDALVSNTSDYMIISSLGDSNRTITITFSNKMIHAGCFKGSLSEFTEAVNLKYKEGSNYHKAIKFITELFN